MLAADLVYKEGKAVGGTGDEDFVDDDDDYGEDIEVDQDGNQLGGDEFGGFDDEGADAADQQDEASLLTQYTPLLHGYD